jgi:hypothetical protein
MALEKGLTMELKMEPKMAVVTECWKGDQKALDLVGNSGVSMVWSLDGCLACCLEIEMVHC